MKKMIGTGAILLIIIFLNACGQREKSESVAPANKEEQSAITNYCNDFPENAEIINQPFVFDKNKGVGLEEGYGSITIAASIITAMQPPYNDNDPSKFTDRVYAVVQNMTNEESEKAFFEYLKNMVPSGNVLNMSTDESPELAFPLGALSNQTFSSTAIMSETDRKKIEDLVNTGEIVTLKLHIPKYIGRGAPEDFSFACKIEVRNEGDQAKSNNAPLEYKNDDYGFSINFPASWKGYLVTLRTLDWGTGGGPSFDFGFPENPSLFNVSVYSKEQWKTLQSVDGPTPALLKENDLYVFGYSPAQDAGSEAMIKRFNEVSEIIKTFKLSK